MTEIKTIYLDQSVYKICKAHPEIKDILSELGFTDITKPGMLQTAGRFMTIPKGARMKGIDMNLITAKFREYGFNPVEEEKDEQRN